jgi:hypothetical protein
MALAETQQLRMLERLRSAGEQPVTLDQLRASRIDFPAVVIELELNGYVIERVYEHGRQIGVRLLETDAPDPPASRRRHHGAEFRGLRVHPCRVWWLQIGWSLEALRRGAGRDDRPELALDAVEQLVVGVAERLRAFALEIGGDGGEIDPSDRGVGEDLLCLGGVGLEGPRDFAVVGEGA